MIECPICHIQNDDRSLFCAECGQRFVLSPNQAIHPQPPTSPVTPPGSQAYPVRPPLKLRSPILGGDYLEGGPAENSGNENTSKNQGFTAGKSGLHSPLLNMGAVEDRQEPEIGTTNGMFPHRANSRLQASAPPSADGTPPVVGRTKPLRSPLLGGGSDEVEEEEIQSPGTKPMRLRSPVLGGPLGPSEEKFEPPRVYDDPNTLRSPLLARRLSKPEGAPESVPPPEATLEVRKRSQPIAQPTGQQVVSPQTEPVGAARPDAYPPVNVPPMMPPGFQPQPMLTDRPGPAPAPYPTVPAMPPGFNAPSAHDFGRADRAPAETPIPSSGILPSGALPPGLLPAPAMDPPPVPPGYQGHATWPIQAPPGSTGGASVISTSMPAGPPKVLPPTSTSSPYVAESTRDNNAEGPVPALQNHSGSSFVPDTESGAPAERVEKVEKVEKYDRQYGAALPPRAGRVASRSKLLPSMEGERDRMGSTQPRKHLALAKFMIVPLFFAVCFKVWYLIAMGAAALQSMPFLGDQVSQLVVIVCLMIFTYLVTAGE